MRIPSFACVRHRNEPAPEPARGYRITRTCFCKTFTLPRCRCCSCWRGMHLFPRACALAVALERIVPEAGTEQSTARCAKHPVIDRSSARARSVSLASANEPDTRLENAKSKAIAPLGVMTMGEILWMMLTMKMPTPARHDERRWPSDDRNHMRTT